LTVKSYLLSLPERFVRSTLGLGAGVVREVGEIAIPDGVRRSQLYQNLVDSTLRFLIENVGGVEGVYAAEETLPENFLVNPRGRLALIWRGPVDDAFLRERVEPLIESQR